MGGIAEVSQVISKIISNREKRQSKAKGVEASSTESKR